MANLGELRPGKDCSHAVYEHDRPLPSAEPPGAQSLRAAGEFPQSHDQASRAGLFSAESLFLNHLCNKCRYLGIFLVGRNLHRTVCESMHFHCQYS